MSLKSKKPSTKFRQRMLQEPNNATKFHPEDSPSGRRLGGMRESFTELYECLRAYNKGWNRDWRDEREVTQKAKADMMESVALQLDLSTQRKEQAEGLIHRIDGRICNGNGGLHMIVICLCQIVVKEDDRCCRYYHPQAKPTKNDRLFSKLVSDFGLDPQEMANSIQKIRFELDL